MTEDPKEKLRGLLEGRNLKQVAKDSGVPYHALWHWATGRGDKFDLGHADKVLRHLTGTGISITEGDAA